MRASASAAARCDASTTSTSEALVERATVPAPSAAARATVRMVPSTGRSTAWRAASLAAARPRARTAPVGVAVPLGEHPGEAPQQLGQDHPGVPPRPHERPVGDGLAHRRHRHGAGVGRPAAVERGGPTARSSSPSRSASSATTDSRVRAMLVPVSPSGTG